jgi:hypothetical protein
LNTLETTSLGGPLLVLSCLGQAADVWHPLPGARHLAVRSRQPPSWSGCRSGEAPDHSASCLQWLPVKGLRPP